MIQLAFIMLVIAALGSLYRIAAGPTLADRIIALDLALISLMGGIAIDAANRGTARYMILIVVIAIIGFTATVAASRFMEVEGREQQRHAGQDPPTAAPGGSS
ncbi:MAG: monovalent cation/H+ antiporter complex subunit F [Actinomycetota bacterium]